MQIYLGSDHRGFNLKETVKAALLGDGYPVKDKGNLKHEEEDDYPDSARAVAELVSVSPDEARGILFCGSGVGVCVVANKYAGVRAALGASGDIVLAGRNDDDINVLCIPSDFTSELQALSLVRVFLGTPFSGEDKHRRRLQKISEIENKS